MQTIQLPYDGEVTLYDPNEGVGLIADACHAAGSVTKGRKNPKQYYNVVMTFDIETTKLLNENWNKKLAEAYRYFNYTFC